MAENWDLVVIGGGPGGYVAAIRAAQLGFKVACIESRGTLGGTCLNVGCIPSKALLQSSEAYFQAVHRGQDMGLIYQGLKADVGQMQARKEKIVKSLTSGIEGLFKKNRITYLKGHGSFLARGKIALKASDGSITEHHYKKAIIATGSSPIELKIAPFDERDILSSTGALALKSPPKHLVVVGGGVIGLEMGSVWARLGSKVSVIEASARILGSMDLDATKVLQKTLGKEGMEFHTETSFKEVKKDKAGLKVSIEGPKGAQVLECDKLLIAVGRRAHTDGLGLENIGLSLAEQGKIAVNAEFQTLDADIYAVGDVIRGPMLAHKAEDEGVACAEIIAGQHGHVNYATIPNIVYTWPELASIGLTEEEAKAQGIEIRVGKFPFAANGRAKCLGDTDGFVKLIGEKTTDKLIGAHIVGPSASELIGELVIGMEFSASTEDIARSVHGHPTLSEVIKQAALQVDQRATQI